MLLLLLRCERFERHGSGGRVVWRGHCLPLNRVHASSMMQHSRFGGRPAGARRDVPAVDVAADSCRGKCPAAFPCHIPRLPCGSSSVGCAVSILSLTTPQLWVFVRHVIRVPRWCSAVQCNVHVTHCPLLLFDVLCSGLLSSLYCPAVPSFVTRIQRRKRRDRKACNRVHVLSPLVRTRQATGSIRAIFKKQRPTTAFHS